MADWKTDDNVIKATGELAKDTIGKLTKIAMENHIPFKDLGDYIDIFIKVLLHMTELILMNMLKDQILEDNDNIKDFNFDGEA